MDQELGALGAGFPPVSLDTWRKVVEKAQGGAKAEDALSSEPEEGLRLRPLYTRADWNAGRSGVPGASPFTRGARLGAWDVRPVIDAPRLADAKAAIAAELEGGASSLALRLAGSEPPKGPWGVLAATLDDLDRLTADIPLANTAIALDAGAQGFAAGAALVALWRRRGVKPHDAAGALNIDPIGAGVDGLQMLSLGSLVRLIDSRYPHVTALAVDLRPYHAAGASGAQEVGIALATGTAYLRLLEEAGLPLERALCQIGFVFATDSNFFFSLAKLRAARLAWSRLIEACGADPSAGPMRIWAETAWHDMAKRDPYVNMLRGTAGCFAAALGGAEAISVRPFDEALAVPGPFARRIARNTQLILAEEAGLARVQDPAGGSWFIESTTEKLAEAGWGLFQDIEREGGIQAALASGRIAALIGAVTERRARRLATRAEPLTGVSIYPDLSEPLVSRADIDWRKILDEAGRRAAASRKAEMEDRLAALKSGRGEDVLDAVFAALEAGAPFAAVEAALGHKPLSRPLVWRRRAEPFEALRDACDALPRRPLVFLANWGRPRDYLDAATFARNLFAIAGIEAIGDQGFSDKDALVKAARESGAKLIVLCTSGEKRAAEGADLLAALKSLAPLKLYVVAPLSDKLGAGEILSEGTDVLPLLRQALRLLGADV
jgi:methylmalonyl-CoA mutase